MKRRALWVFFAFFLAVTAAQSTFAQVSATVDSVQKVVLGVRQQFCPDRRVDLFDVTVQSAGDTVVLTGETTSPRAYAALRQRVRGIVLTERLRNQVVLLPDSTVSEHGWALVTVSVANMRRRPSHSSELLNQMLLGTPLRIYKTRPPWWFFVRSEEGYLGWTDDGGIWLTDSLGVARWRQAKRVIVTAKETEVLSEKRKGAVPVSDVVVGDILALKGQEGDWLHVALPDGRSGWLPKNAATSLRDFLAEANPTAEDIVRDAFQFMGRPYLWGGKSSKGLDCSGFTSIVYRMNGVLLPRDANMQAEVGAEVPLDSVFSKLAPGDLVFFGPRPDRITHVGIYIGDKRYIHSDSHIHVNSFDPAAPDFSAYRLKAFRRARRILGHLRRDPATGWLLPEGMRPPGLFGEKTWAN